MLRKFYVEGGGRNPVIKKMYNHDLEYVLLSDVQFWDLKGQQ